MFQKQIPVTAKVVADHSQRSRLCSVGIAARNGSIPGLRSQTAFYSMLTVHYVTRGPGGRNVKLTAYLCILLHRYSPDMPS
jgi:hypothetical protein